MGLPPLRIHVKPGVEPVAIHRPSTIPAHWIVQVRKDIEQDIDLGVLERVLSNTPTTWCSRMHVVGKKIGEPRRVVDLRAVNQATSRQTHVTEPPFRQAMSVPPHTWRFTSDAWNGYHSIPINERDRHITTFLTPWGSMRYRVAPQGSIISGDGYTFWYDAIIRHIQHMKKCVDDVLGWAKSLLQLFHNTAYFLSHTGAHGVIQNPKKFVWGRRELEYVGFWLKDNGIKPTDETLSSISNFPRPSDITGIRSWFGLVEQVAFSFSKTRLMEPCRKLLAKNSEYLWTDKLQTSLELAKTEIVKPVAKGVTSYKLDSWTCLVTDWSKTGIGYVMWQKHCACSTIHPTCCEGGWSMITCGLRFCTAAETRYHPIEGELLRVTWALEKTAYYTLGSDKLLVLVDHKPLLGLLTTWILGEIENLAERLLHWNFRIQHIAGAKNFAPNALSRSPTQDNSIKTTPQECHYTRSGTSSRPYVVGPSPALNTIQDTDQQQSDDLEAQVLANTANTPVLITSWPDLRTSGISDTEYSSLLHAVNSDLTSESWPVDLQDYKRHREHMRSVDGVVLFKGRAVIPAVLRPQILQSLYQSHQGVSGMTLSSQNSVWWPNITHDIDQVHATCSVCHRNAPT